MTCDAHGARVLAIGRDDVARLLAVESLLEALEAAFVAFSAGTCDAPPRIGARGVGIARRDARLRAGGASGAEGHHGVPGNHAAGLPFHQGLIVIFDEHGGRPLAIMDAAHVTAMRTEGASAVSARRLARDDAGVLTIVGAGAQGRAHLVLLTAVRDFHDIRIASRTLDHARALVGRHPKATAVGTVAEAIRDADAWRRRGR